MQLPPFWQVTPIGLTVVVVALVHEMGLRWLALRQTPAHRAATRRRSWAFYAGLLGLFLVVSGPLERWAMAWLSVHMVMHVLEMFYLPPLLIIGAPWVPLAFALPVDQRRRLLRAWYRSPWWAPAARAGTASSPSPSSRSSSSTGPWCCGTSPPSTTGPRGTTGP